MEEKKIRRACSIIFILTVLIAILLYCVGGEQFHYRDDKTAMVTPSTVIGEILDGQVVTQRLKLDGDIMTSITLMSARYQEQVAGKVQLSILDDDHVLLTQEVDFAQLPNNAKAYIPLEEQVNIPNDGILTLELRSDGAKTGNAVTFYGGNTMSATRAEVVVGLDEEDCVHINGQPLEVQLSTEITTRSKLLFGSYYPYGMGAILLLLLVYMVYTVNRVKKGKKTAVILLIDEFVRYKFLMKQLISRDFKTKYKRSVLGVLWSFLNPLLTMLVQYLVFSTIFKSNIENFALYLLVGIVCFSFFSEATSMSLTSIVGNASLITKVYMPKYIYPLSRVLSSLVNFAFSLIPLFVVMLVTGANITPSLLLIPIAVLSLFFLSLGVGLLLSSLMVFFRDMQFLWGVISMLWMYATPIFYPESILPENLMPLFKLNPLYHIIRFMRIILLDGISPEPKAYLLMLIACVVPFIIGYTVFKRTEDRFILHI